MVSVKSLGLFIQNSYKVQTYGLLGTLLVTIWLMLFALPVVANEVESALEAVAAGDFKKAIQLLKPLAERGNANAQYNLGIMYYRGDGVRKNFSEAINWIRLAAEQNHQLAQWQLGRAYEKSEGVARDYNTAAQWYRAAAIQGNRYAQTDLGVMHLTGQGVQKDYDLALKWITLAAEQGHITAFANLGVFASKGWGKKNDQIYAYMWWNLAALRGHKASEKMRDSLSKKMSAAQILEAQILTNNCIEQKYKDC